MKKTRVREFQLGTSRKTSEDTRIAAVRHLPRFMDAPAALREWRADAWISQLAPSARLLQRNKRKHGTPDWWVWFSGAYQAEILRDPTRSGWSSCLASSQSGRLSPSAVIATEGARTGCHRFVLERLIRKSAAGKLGV